MPACLQLVPGGRGELVMQKRLPGSGAGAAGGAEGENEDSEEATAAAAAAGGSKHGTLEKYSGVKVKVGSGVQGG